MRERKGNIRRGGDSGKERRVRDSILPEPKETSLPSWLRDAPSLSLRYKAGDVVEYMLTAVILLFGDIALDCAEIAPK